MARTAHDHFVREIEKARVLREMSQDLSSWLMHSYVDTSAGALMDPERAITLGDRDAFDVLLDEEVI